MNRVSKLIMEDGGVVETRSTIEGSFLIFYKKLLGSSKDCLQGIDVGIARAGSVLADFQRSVLIQAPIVYEIDDALRGIHKVSAPGPDGFNSSFFL